MVKKITVIALVLIVAAPILMGYAMALDQYQATGFKDSDYTNVTPLIQNSDTYDLSEANAYSLNSDVFYVSGNLNANHDYETPHFYPKYKHYSSAVSPIVKSDLKIRSLPWDGLTMFDTYYIQGAIVGSPNYDHNNYVRATLYDDNLHVIDVIDGFRYYSYTRTTGVLNYAVYDIYSSYYRYGEATGVNEVYIEKIGTGSWQVYSWWDASDWTDSYRSSNKFFADLSQGYTLDIWNGDFNAGKLQTWRPGNYVEDFIITVDLKTLLPSWNSTFGMSFYYDDPDNPVEDGVLGSISGFSIKRWYNNEVYLMGQDSSLESQLIFDPNSDNNVYQIKVMKTGIEVRYVGAWPTQIAPANYYRVWKQDFATPIDPQYSIECGVFNGTMNQSGVIRFDAATYRSYTYKVTEDLTYDPTTIISNDNLVTKIQAVTKTGSSITFGGNTYTTSNGDLMLGTHKIPLNGIKFETVLNEDYTYDNRINGTTVSTTAAPSTITFNGKWVVNVASSELTTYNYTKTEWKVGEFGWNGIDTNFLIVGLITCLAVFIGLGIYARKSRSGGIIPLMIITGCAAAVFFIML